MKKTIAVATLCVLLAGCQNASNGSKTKTTSAAAATTTSTGVAQPQQQQPAPAITPSTGTDSMMYSCMKELNALQQVNTSLYQNRNTQLNHIVTQAKLYMKVRGNVSADVHQIMDAAYQFRISKICNQIRSDLTNSLVEHAEKS